MASALVTAPAEAHRSPVTCASNGLELLIGADRMLVRNGDTVQYSVSVANDAPGACDVTGATVTLALPDADGAPSSSPSTLVAGGSFAGGAPVMSLGPFQHTVAVNAGVDNAVARVSAAGTVHDGDLDQPASISKTIGAQVTQPLMTLSVLPTPLGGQVPLNVNYAYTLTNASTTPVAMSGVGVAAGGCTVAFESGDANTNGLLDVAEAWKFGCSRLFTTAGTYTSTANAVGTSVVDARAVTAGPTNATVVATAPKPHLTLTKTASPASGVAPLAVTFSYTVHNDGEATTTLSDVAVTDAQCGPVVRGGTDAGTDGLLSVGETWTFTCSTSFAAPGNYSGTAVARGVNTVDGQPVASDPAGATIAWTHRRWSCPSHPRPPRPSRPRGPPSA